MTTWGGDTKFQYQVCAPRRPYVLCMLDRKVPPRWSQPGCISQSRIQIPENYIVLILTRLTLVPAGDHGTIPAAMRNSKSQLFKYGECDKDGRQRSGSKLYYINPWAMCWPSDHPKRPLTG